MSNYRFTLWLWSPIGRTLNHVLWRFGPWKRWTARKVWAEIAQDPVFIAGIEAGKADLAAGRFVPYRSSPVRGALDPGNGNQVAASPEAPVARLPRAVRRP